MCVRDKTATRQHVQLILNTTTKDYSVPNNGAKNLIDLIYKKNFLLLFIIMLLKNGFGLNHCKCTDHTSNKVDFISPNIIPTWID